MIHDTDKICLCFKIKVLTSSYNRNEPTLSATVAGETSSRSLSADTLQLLTGILFNFNEHASLNQLHMMSSRTQIIRVLFFHVKAKIGVRKK